jgi:MFS family permease
VVKINREHPPKVPFVASLFLTSISLFVYEVTTTRIFSPVLRYHFVFLLTSMAIFGLGVGGVIAYYWFRRFGEQRITAHLPGWQLVLAASYILSFSLMYKLPFITFSITYALIAALPFVAGGISVSLLFMIMPENSNILYCADLMGAGIGSAVVIVFLNRLSVVTTVLIITGFAAVSALILTVFLGERKQAVIPLAILLVFSFLGISQPLIRQFERRFTGYFTSPLTMLTRLRVSNQAHRLEDWVWDAFARTDLIDAESYPRSKLLTIDGGSTSEMIRFNGNLSEVNYLRRDLEFLPFALGPNRSVLLIGPGGGKDIVLSLLGGSQEIHAVEINPGTIRLARKYASYNGGIYDREEVRVHVQDGRNFVQQSRRTYDLIYLARVMSDAAGIVGHALAENFIYTREAIRDYWGRLADDGKLTFVLHGDQDLARLLRTVRLALEEEGLTESQVKARVAVADHGSHPGEGTHMPLVVIQKSPLGEQEISSLNRWVEAGGHQLVYLADGGHESFWQRYIRGTLISITPSGRTRKTRLTPTTDDRPYFYDFMPGIHNDLLVILAAVVLIFLVFFRPSLQKGGLRRSPYYFIGLGLGFMLIEIPLIQQFTLFLGHPTRSFFFTLVSLLAGGGLGSLAGGWRRLRWKRRYLPLCLVSLTASGVYGSFQMVIGGWPVPSAGLRAALVVLLTFPLGFFMGMPFPFGLKELKKENLEPVIPLMWGINGTMSVGGSTLAVILSMKVGSSYALMLGGAIYLALFWFMPLYERAWKVR